MPLRYQKRISLSKGIGLNVSQSGVSASVRTKRGSVGTKGFSIKTGIPGLSYRTNWGKNGGVILLALLLITGVVLIACNVLRLIVYAVGIAYEFIKHRFVRE